MESVEETNPGYDEYIINGKEKIGHNVHELLSYITSRYGVVKEVSEIAGEIQQLFNQIYTLTYDEEIEIRYKTVKGAQLIEVPAHGGGRGLERLGQGGGAGHLVFAQLLQESALTSLFDHGTNLQSTPTSRNKFEHQ